MTLVRPVIIGFLLLSGAGCASTQNSSSSCSDHCVEYGRPSRIVDGAGWLLGTGDMFLLGDMGVSNHDVSQETVEDVVAYLDKHGLEQTKVRVNQYDPGGEWRRLRENKSISPGWKYTVGTVDTLFYTLIPGRVFGYDNYSPFTNTLHLYSDMPAIGITQSAMAVDISQRRRPGAYATVQSLPIVGQWSKSLATNNAIEHFKGNTSEEELEHIRHVLRAQHGVSIGGEATSVFAPGLVFLGQVAGAIAGHGQAYVQNWMYRGEETSTEFQISTSQRFTPDID